MRDRRDPWRWPFSISLALVLTLAAFFLTPPAWIDFFLSPLDLNELAGERPAQTWLELLPPPRIQVEKMFVPPLKLPPRRPAVADDRWWTEAWRVRTFAAVKDDIRPTAADSVQVLLDMLDMTPDVLALTRPDSVLASRLWLMRLEDSFAFDELKPYLGAMTRSRAYADIMSRAADMYGDFLQSEIMVPD